MFQNCKEPEFEPTGLSLLTLRTNLRRSFCLLADSELRYPYEGSKTLMHVFDRFEDAALVLELLDGMYTELPEKKPKRKKI